MDQLCYQADVKVGHWWLIGRFEAFRPKGRGFKSHSSCHIGALGKSFTRSCLWCFGVKLRHSILEGLGGVVVIDAAIGAHGRGSRPAHYFTVAATLDKSLTSHCL